MKILAIANQKGGVGKTTTTLNLGACLAALGRHVLLCDLDPQSSLTLSTVGDSSGRSLAEVLGDSQPGKLALSKVIRNLSPGVDLVPGDMALARSELGLVTRYKREDVLKRALATAQGYDLAIIDSPPSLGLLTINGLAAADAVICPTLPTALDLRGVGLFLDSLEDIRNNELNPTLKLLGILITQYDPRLTLHRSAMADIQKAGLPLFPVAIGKSIRAAATAGAGQPLDRGNLAEQYKLLALEVDKWLMT